MVFACETCLQPRNPKHFTKKSKNVIKNTKNKNREVVSASGTCLEPQNQKKSRRNPKKSSKYSTKKLDKPDERLVKWFPLAEPASSQGELAFQEDWFLHKIFQTFLWNLIICGSLMQCIICMIIDYEMLSHLKSFHRWHFQLNCRKKYVSVCHL